MKQIYGYKIKLNVNICFIFYVIIIIIIIIWDTQLRDKHAPLQLIKIANLHIPNTEGS